ncbi:MULTISPECIES: antibiotic biosynthesis monooxygenase [unclassified Paenibacillus]|uniref:antibiotic biosynthesis monooxygenase family protein n=1 Tax=unclassified Paenibacillus TaxID=185978 RepID=UPI001047D1DC|nr:MULTISPECIES: antibiotic biosynthesis monooxygenase [unclassified Paenibacillus]NIK70338.1 heme-degrading monooxygenase HmoA [Paenibacillus sp. BK720]TCM90738.1 heme-degrading monooxygenase HmoA [Paenibacillus sp. BK033]
MSNEAAGSYYAVIFSSQRTDGDHGYGAMDDKMDELAAKQPGFLSAESVRNASGAGITISYWESLEAIHNWKQNELHRAAQEKGKQVWYQSYNVKICKVERAYSYAAADLS